jgi:hypothetical protein
MTTIHTRQLQQYTQDNYNSTRKTTNNNTHKTTTKIHTTTNNTHKTTYNTHMTTTTIHTRQLTTIHKIYLKIRHVEKVNNSFVLLGSNPPYMIFICIFVIIRIRAKLREFHDVLNSFRTATEWRAKKKMVESLVAEQIFWLLAKDDQYFVLIYCDTSIQSVSRIHFFLL